MNKVYINRISSFLPNSPIAKENIEDYLGLINGNKSKSRAIVLRNNGIETRYYAIDKEGNSTHTNAELVKLSIEKLFKDNLSEISEVDLLCCGTTSPDQLLPSHSVMVHGLLPQSKNIEVTSNSGSCCSGMHAFKYAYLSVMAGQKKKALCSGSEKLSSILKSDKFEEEAKKLDELKENPYVSFEKDFLRWMLSDGAGVMLLEPQKNSNGLSLEVNWIELSSYANEKETCMYMGAEKLEDASLKGYGEMKSEEIINKSVLTLKQDVKILSENIVPLGFNKLKVILDEKGVKASEIDYFLPHMSSHFFQPKIYEILEKNGIPIPYEKWFTNLKTKGNVGAGSIYLMLDELFNEKDLKIGDKILLAVPESARFSYAFCLLTVC